MKYTLTFTTEDPAEMASAAHALAMALGPIPAIAATVGTIPTHPSSPSPQPSRSREPGDDDEPVEEEKPPTDGRQLLGWAGQQVPDAMPAIKQWGMRKKIKARIVDWSQRDVLACYAHVRGTMAR